MPGGKPLTKKTLMCDVQVVAVLANGMPFPDEIRVQRNVQIVIWAADADKLEIEFPSGNPFGTPVRCEGRFCGTLVPPSGAAGSYKYTVKATTGTKTQRVDPKVIIWE